MASMDTQNNIPNLIVGTTIAAGTGIATVGTKTILDEVSKNNVAIKLATEKLSEGDYVKFTLNQLRKEAKEAKKPLMEFIKTKFQTEFKSFKEVTEHIKTGFKGFIDGVMAKTPEEIKKIQDGKIGFLETAKEHLSSIENAKAFWATIKKPALIVAGIFAGLYLANKAIHNNQEA